MSNISDPYQSLDDAYRATDFWVQGPKGRFAICIGQTNEPLESLLASEGVQTWAYMTAYNPKSQPLSENENSERMHRFEEAVIKTCYPFFMGEGIGRIGNWPPEPSMLIVGIDEASAKILASHYGQNAIVCGNIGEPARLVWIEPTERVFELADHE